MLSDARKTLVGRGARVHGSKWHLLVFSIPYFPQVCVCACVHVCVCVRVCVFVSVECCACQYSDVHVVWQRGMSMLPAASAASSA